MEWLYREYRAYYQLESPFKWLDKLSGECKQTNANICAAVVAIDKLAELEPGAPTEGQVEVLPGQKFSVGDSIKGFGGIRWHPFGSKAPGFLCVYSHFAGTLHELQHAVVAYFRLQVGNGTI